MAEGDQVDLSQEFTDEKMRMATAKSAMTRKIRRLESVLTEFKELDALHTTIISSAIRLDLSPSAKAVSRHCQ